MFNGWFKPWGDECVKDGVATIRCISVVFENLLSALLAFAGLAALLMFLMGSFKYINSAGDPKKTEGAKNNFTYGIIGAVIVFASFLIINIISTVTGVKCIVDITKFGFNCQ